MSALPKIRHDLVYTRDSSDERYYFVKDPIRSQFFRYNELQVVMMKALDGNRSVEEIIEILGEEFGFEADEGSIERLVARLEKDLLLDVTAYRMRSADDRKRVRQALHARGVVWRGAGKPAAGGKEARKESRESALFQEGIRTIEEGDPCGAGKYFGEILEINPHNKRARAVLDALHEVFFQRHRVIPAHWSMLPLWNPDRFLGRLDAAIGRWLFGPLAAVLLVVLVLLSIEPLVDLRVPEQFSWVDFAMYPPLSLTWLALHELGHGLCCKHYGGRVTEMGMLLMFGVVPGAYCDTSDTYTFADKKHKIVVSLGGVYVSLVVNLILLLVVHYTSDTFFLRNTILILLVHTGFLTFQNLVPFIPLDGYYALADYLDVRNLRERSLQYVRQKVSKLFLGFSSQETEGTERERRIFLIFGVCSIAFTVWYVYGLWISQLLPALIEYLGTAGIVFAAIYAFRIAKDALIRPVIALIRMVIPNRKQIFTLRRSAAFVLAASALVGILSIKWPLYVDGEWTAQPKERIVIRALEPGQIERIAVREGAAVRKGDVIAVIRNEELRHALDQAEAELARAESRLALVKSGATREDIALAMAKAETARVQQRYARQRAERSTALSDASVVSSAAAMRDRRVAAASSANRTDAALSLALVQAGARVEDVDAAEAEVQKLAARKQDLELQLAHLTLVSPIDGVVVGTRLEELVDQRVSRGSAICEVHDLTSIRAEVNLPLGDMFGAVSVGQAVALRANGDPHRGVRTHVARVRPGTEKNGSIVVETEVLGNPGWPTGFSGHSRIYGEHRTIAFLVFGVPLFRLINLEAWRLIGG